ncbi:MAG: murein transglycosylase A [Alphaproteobacteria bacterium]|nr:murein transglycosylase A [Alphaproteobacteria bacterium]
MIMKYFPTLTKALFFTGLLFLSACAESLIDEDSPATLRPAAFGDLPGWETDDLKSFPAAMRRSCERLAKMDASRALTPSLEQTGTAGDWAPFCQALTSLPAQADDASIREVVETHLRPYQVRAGSRKNGLFTGYYEASLHGSRTRFGPYRIPLHARPDDLVMVQLGDFREALKGQRIAGRVVDGNLKPYESREQIVAGQWPHGDKVLVWVDDPVEAFFVQIQGSGVVELADGTLMRIGYAGQNGHPYYAIGRELIKRGALTKDNVSMQAIRQWLEAHPDEADEIMNTNKSYVFFHEIKGEGPLGGSGTVLTEGRSLAVDRTKIPYNVPLWVNIAPPVKEEKNTVQRLMVAQDTGGAIRGAVRGDVFWGHGETAEYLAGHMKSKGQYWILLPKNP